MKRGEEVTDEQLQILQEFANSHRALDWCAVQEAIRAALDELDNAKRERGAALDCIVKLVSGEGCEINCLKQRAEAAELTRNLAQAEANRQLERARRYRDRAKKLLDVARWQKAEAEYQRQRRREAENERDAAFMKVQEFSCSINPCRKGDRE